MSAKRAWITSEVASERPKVTRSLTKAVTSSSAPCAIPTQMPATFVRPNSTMDIICANPGPFDADHAVGRDPAVLHGEATETDRAQAGGVVDVAEDETGVVASEEKHGDAAAP